MAMGVEQISMILKSCSTMIWETKQNKTQRSFWKKKRIQFLGNGKRSKYTCCIDDKRQVHLGVKDLQVQGG